MEGSWPRSLRGPNFVTSSIESQQQFVELQIYTIQVTEPLKMAETALTTTSLDALSKIAEGKVRDLYEVDSKTLLFVATDRISAYDVIMDNVRIPIPLVPPLSLTSQGHPRQRRPPNPPLRALVYSFTNSHSLPPHTLPEPLSPHLHTYLSAKSPTKPINASPPPKDLPYRSYR
jgi:phosphoribosylaminoimidazole-succinocarboxamide synthase